MNCPLCIDQTLEITHRQGIELDICPKCRGIWLDRGEIDRLIAESGPPPPSAAATSAHRSIKDRSFDADDMVRRESSREASRSKKSDKSKKKRKKKSLADRLGDALEEVFDELT